jgi:uncharacterized protein (DUF433 family)
MAENNGHTLENARETPVEPWTHLVRRRHPWRKQLYVKGRNMTARQLVGAMLANKLTQEEVANDYGLPVEVVKEALIYVEQDKELIAGETETERLTQPQPQGGVARGPQPVS